MNWYGRNPPGLEPVPIPQDLEFLPAALANPDPTRAVQVDEEKLMKLVGHGHLVGCISSESFQSSLIRRYMMIHVDTNATSMS